MSSSAQTTPGSPAVLAIVVTLASIAAVSAAESPEVRMPLEIRSEREDRAVRVRVEGTIDRPIDGVAALLADPLHWCQFVPIDPTVRGCVWHSLGEGAALVTLFGGREKDLMPDTTFELSYRLDVASRSDDALEVLLHGDQGPAGSRDYRLRLRAARAGDDRTRLEVTTSSRMSETLEAITQGYLETVGRDKFGFTVTGRDAAGRPRYVKGIRGLIERGAMRQYLSLQAYLDSIDVPLDERFEASIQRWWRLSQRHPQLEEVSRVGYLEEQRRDYRRQTRLQGERGASVQRHPAESTR